MGSRTEEINAFAIAANDERPTDANEPRHGPRSDEARIPDLKTALGTCCGGQITPTCCAAMTPVISGKCLCQEKPIELLKGFLGQDPADFIGVASDILGKLGCSAL